MKRNALNRSASALALFCATSLIAVAACNRSGQTAAAGSPGDVAPPLSALPLTTISTPVTPAPLANALPPAPRPRFARTANPGDAYAYLDRAYAMSHAFGDAPPDYAVDYQGVRPWVWRGQDNSERVVERLPNGLRYYYYQPGADEPYFIQDPDYGYAYSGDELVSVYDQGGGLVPYDRWDERADIAGRYLARSRALYYASLHQERLAVEQAHWNERHAQIAEEQAQWAQQQSQYAAWDAYHQAHAAEEQAHWADERYRREAYAARYAQSQDDAGAAATAWRSAQEARDHGRPNGQDGYPGVNGPAGPNPGPQGPYASGQPGGPAPGDDPGRRHALEAGAVVGAGAVALATQHALQAHTQQQAVQAQQAAQQQAQATQQAAIQRQAAAQQAQVQARAQVEAQRQAAAQAHAAALAQRQAAQQGAVQRQAAENARRQAAAQQAQAQASAQVDAQRQAAAQAHAAALAQRQGAQQASVQRQAAENAQRQAAAQQAQAQARAQGDAQRQAAAQAHAAAVAQRQAAPSAARPASANAVRPAPADPHRDDRHPPEGQPRP